MLFRLTQYNYLSLYPLDYRASLKTPFDLLLKEKD